MEPWRGPPTPTGPLTGLADSASPTGAVHPESCPWGTPRLQVTLA